VEQLEEELVEQLEELSVEMATCHQIHLHQNTEILNEG
jgi:hypothetical protein